MSGKCPGYGKIKAGLSRFSTAVKAMRDRRESRRSESIFLSAPLDPKSFSSRMHYGRQKDTRHHYQKSQSQLRSPATKKEICFSKRGSCVRRKERENVPSSLYLDIAPLVDFYPLSLSVFLPNYLWWGKTA